MEKSLMIISKQLVRLLLSSWRIILKPLPLVGLRCHPQVGLEFCVTLGKLLHSSESLSKGQYAVISFCPVGWGSHAVIISVAKNHHPQDFIKVAPSARGVGEGQRALLGSMMKTERTVSVVGIGVDHVVEVRNLLSGSAKIG